MLIYQSAVGRKIYQCLISQHEKIPRDWTGERKSAGTLFIENEIKLYTIQECTGDETRACK